MITLTQVTRTLGVNRYLLKIGTKYQFHMSKKEVISLAKDIIPLVHIQGYITISFRKFKSICKWNNGYSECDYFKDDLQIFSDVECSAKVCPYYRKGEK